MKSATKYHTEINGTARLRDCETARLRSCGTAGLRDSRIARLFLVCLFVVLCCTIKAQIPNRPNPPRLVNDFTNTLSSSEITALEQRLVAYNDTTSTQFTVVLVDDLQGYDIAQYATELGHSWGVGQGAKDNGAVILIKPKNDKGNGQVNISAGYGLEPYITDAAATAIIQKEMIPFFKENDYYQGINNAVTVMMDLCSGKFTPDEYMGDSVGTIIGYILIIIIIILVVCASNSTTYSGSGSNGHVIFMPGPGSFGGGSSGGFGGGGGGFSGFGGGHFGGGGASGSW